MISRTEDDGTVVYAVEVLEDGTDGQSVSVRAGAVYHAGGQDNDPGIWIEYQSQHRNSNVEGPVLLSIESWRELVTAVEQQLERRGYRRTIVGNSYIARELGVKRSTVSNWVTRDILPDELAPEWVEAGSTDVAVWRRSQVPAFRTWHERHSNARQLHEAE